MKDKLNIFAHLKNDIPAGLVVFLVAVPLCLGIALASNAPIFSGLIAGIIGGLVIPMISRSELSVSGPAAGLIAIVIMGIEQLGGWEGFLTAIVLAGILQMILGVVKAGTIAYFFPASVIKGMLAGIGLIIILKQIPHALGVDVEAFGSDTFSVQEGSNTFTLLLDAFRDLELGALIIGLFSILLIVFYNKSPLKKLQWLPSGLVAVFMGVLINHIFKLYAPDLALGQEHLVFLRDINHPTDVLNKLTFPDWSALTNFNVYVVAVTVAVIASLESLLCVEAVDKLDPYKRKSPMSRELIAQGAGNTISGLIGGLPITSVIVRSGANVTAGGRTRMSAIVHGIFLLVSVVFAYNLLNMIPLATLAAVLIIVGYNLAKPMLFRNMYKLGFDQFVPFIVTVGAILLTDLLRGIIIGMVVGIFYVLKRNYESPYFFKKTKSDDNHVIHLELSENVTFMNKASIRKVLSQVEEGSKVVIDASKSVFIDYDVIEMLQDFEESVMHKDIELEIIGDITGGSAGSKIIKPQNAPDEL